MFNKFTDFIRNEDGAVTVDFVVLTAATVGLGVAVLGVVSGGIENVSQDVDDQLVSQVIQTSFVEPLTFAGQNPLMSAWIEEPVCIMSGGGGDQDGDAVQFSCSGGGSGTNSFYTMSDGSSWTRKEFSPNDGPTTTTWYDGDGEEVAADDVPDIPDDLPIIW